MDIVNIHQALQEKEYYIHQMAHDKIFIYPTDSLYGIGALFTQENIEKIAHIKNRDVDKKMNIIAPSFEWIEKHFIVNNMDFLLDSFEKYHATTFVLEPKDSTGNIALYGTDHENNTIGVRIIKHPFQEFITNLGQPFISTSANIAGNPNIKNISELDNEILNKVDYVIDGGDVFGIASVLIFDKTKEILKRE